MITEFMDFILNDELHFYWNENYDFKLWLWISLKKIKILGNIFNTGK